VDGLIEGMAGRYTGSYLDRSNGWRAVVILADIGQASLVGRIPDMAIRILPRRRQRLGGLDTQLARPSGMRMGRCWAVARWVGNDFARLGYSDQLRH
jgi:hypothetical protein